MADKEDSASVLYSAVPVDDTANLEVVPALTASMLTSKNKKKPKRKRKNNNNNGTKKPSDAPKRFKRCVMYSHIINLIQRKQHHFDCLFLHQSIYLMCLVVFCSSFIFFSMEKHREIKAKIAREGTKVCRHFKHKFHVCVLKSKSSSKLCKTAVKLI